MPEAASAASAPDTAAAPSALDQIDALMADAFTKAQTGESTSTETPPTDTEQSGTSEQQAAEEPRDEPAETDQDEAQETAATADQNTQDPPATPKTPSRREAARLQEQLLAAEERNRTLQQQLGERTAVDDQVRQKYAQRLGTPQEKQQLEATLANANASFQDVDNARTRLREMKTASEELAPIYQAVEKDVFGSFIRGLNELRSLDGMDETSHQALFKARTGVDAMRQMYEIGRKAAAADADGEIQGLKASLSELRTRHAAKGAQPAAGSGSNAPTTALSGLIGADGLPTDEAIERARSGALRGLGAS